MLEMFTVKARYLSKRSRLKLLTRNHPQPLDPNLSQELIAVGGRRGRFVLEELTDALA